MSTEQQFLVTVQVDGYGDLGIFDKRSGGDSTIAVAKHRPGGMGPEKSYTTLPTYSAITISRVYERVRDLAGNTLVTISEQPLDGNGNAWGSPTVWRGRLGNVKAGPVDSTSSAVRMFELDMDPETVS
jgi:hypothetical protein